MRIAGPLLVALVALLVGLPPALGHTDVVATIPAEGARLASAPAEVRVTYGQPLLSVEAAAVTVEGTSVAGRPRLARADAGTVVIPVVAERTGAHAVSWTVLAADGHALAGTMSFSVRGPAVPAMLRPVSDALLAAGVELRAVASAAA